MKRLIPLLFLILPSLAKPESQAIGPFGGLNNSESATLIGDNEAQDLQDVDFSANGLSIIKRSGKATFRSIGVSTHSVTGTYYFRDADDDSFLIAANDGSVYYSQDSGTFTEFVSTDTSGAFYDFADSQGALWRANSSKDEIWKWDGTTLTYYPSHPKGDQVEILPDRLVISGTDANPNRINFSGAADFTNFATGTDESDPFYEELFLPGQKVTAIKAACGGVLAWTRDSMAFWTGTNQFDGQVIDISQTIGTIQPSSVINDLGVTYWQAQDGHFYSYDCNGVSRISSKVDVSGFANGTPKSWTQTSDSDWDAGTLTYTTNDLTSGDVQLSTWTDTDTTTADFDSGTTSNTSVISNAVYLSTNNTNLVNNSFEDALGSEWTCAAGTDGDYAGCGRATSSGGVSPQSGTYLMRIATVSFTSSPEIRTYILDASGNTLTSQNDGAPSSWTQKSISLASYAGRWIKIRFEARNLGLSQKYLTSSAFLCSGSTISYYLYLNQPGTGLENGWLLDVVTGGRSTTYSGTFTSQTFDTGFSTGAWLSSSVTSTSNSHSITWQTQSSPDGTNWDSAVSWTPGSAPASDWDKYIRYVITLSTGGTTDGTALPYVEDVSLAARASSGTFTSQTKQIGALATSFGNFTADSTLNSGTIGYFMRTATTEGGLSAASWTALTSGSQIGATINPWVQVKATFTITSDATRDPTLHSFSINWNEGSITRHWGVVDQDHRLMWSIAEDADTQPSVSYIYDQRFNGWLKYSFPFYAPSRTGETVYFGSPTAGTVFQWPSGTSDDGSAITAYWQSKSFIAGDPFIEKSFSRYSFLGAAKTGSNLDITYSLDGLSGTTVNFSLTDPVSSVNRNINDNLPIGAIGRTINWKFGNDDADAPFELWGFRFEWTPEGWRVLP